LAVQFLVNEFNALSLYANKTEKIQYYFLEIKIERKTYERNEVEKSISDLKISSMTHLELLIQLLR